jgi:hypothetical protein
MTEEKVWPYIRSFEADDCFCCGHDRDAHAEHDEDGKQTGAYIACTAELFNITETILTDCPCGAFVETVPE